jgi:hypothetical protein
VSSLAGMSHEDRKRTLGDYWDIAAGRLLREKGKVRRNVSPGVARGAGGSGTATRRRVKYTMSEKEKKQLYDSARGTDGTISDTAKARVARQIAEIEHGVTSDPEIARVVGENSRFAEMARTVI